MDQVAVGPVFFLASALDSLVQSTPDLWTVRVVVAVPPELVPAASLQLLRLVSLGMPLDHISCDVAEADAADA